MMYKPIASILAVSCLTILLAGGAFGLSLGDTLVGNVFVNGYDGWTDMVNQTGDEGTKPNWGVLLTDSQALMECSNGKAAANGSVSGEFYPFMMVNTTYTTPEVYTLSATMGSWDDDGLGMVFGFQDVGNYFRVAFREQGSDTGHPRATSMQKVVNGVISVVQPKTTTFYPPMDGVTTFNPVLSVDGTTGDYSLTVNGSLIFSGNDVDLTSSGANLAAGHYGTYSWCQKQDTATSASLAAASKERGSLTYSMAVASQTFNKTTTFADIIPVAWRNVNMVNAKGYDLWGLDEGASVYEGQDFGNFRQDFRDGSILEDSNGFDWATTAAPNVDFIGPAVVIDEEGSDAWTDYEMTVRITARDDEGPGVLVRVQDDDTFYRVNFGRQAMGTNEDHCPIGMSIQKCLDGVWTELFRDDQGVDEVTGDPLAKFVYTDDHDGGPFPFDVKVRVVGDTISVQVTEGTNVITYDPVVDTTDPILSGTVGLTNWGGGDADNGTSFSAYGGEAGHALLTAIPEPSSLVLLSLLALFGLARRRS